MNEKNYNMKTAADVKAERIRLQALITEKENKFKGEVKKVKDKFNPIPGITSLFNKNKENRSTRAVVDTGVNFLVGKVIAKRLGFLPTFVTPFISKTVSEQVMGLNLRPYLINSLDWIIEKTEVDESDTKSPVVLVPESAIPLTNTTLAKKA